MEFTSFSYLAFLLCAVLVIRRLQGRTRELALLVFSLVFYASWDVRFLAVLLGIGVFTYGAGAWVARRRTYSGKLFLPIAAILLVLAYFKYTQMLVDGVNLVLPSGRALTPVSIVLPLGISFFTFECISYLLDVYKGAPELRPLRRFLLFPSFWPHMIAGPILRLKEFVPQLEAPNWPTRAESLQAIDRILFGFTKKVVLANSLATVADQGFRGGAVTNSALDNWVSAVAFGLQIYFDFSAYSDIAIGSANLVGIRLPENFSDPYHARSPSEFWTRWHMTLSRWIRDYLFFPLNLRAGRRLWLRYLYLIGVMAVVGLWHGAAVTFVLWGVWHGLLMVAHRLIEKRAAPLPPWLRGAAGWAVTFAFVQAGWVLFRATDLGQAFRMLGSMATLRGLKPAFGINDYMLVATALTFYFLLEPRIRRFLTREANDLTFGPWTFWLRPVVYAFSIQLIFMFDRTNVAFIYFQF